MPTLSSSVAKTQPRPVVDSARMIEFNSSRFLDVSFLESLSSENQGLISGGKMTAPTTSGPARGPRPTSSMPRIGIIWSRRCLLYRFWILLAVR